MKRGKMIAEILIGAASFGAIVAHTESRHRDSIRRTDETRVKNEELAQSLSQRKLEEDRLQTELVSAKTELAALKSRPTPAEIYNRADWLAHILTTSHAVPLLPIIPPTYRPGGGSGVLIKFNGVQYILTVYHIQRYADEDIADGATIWLKAPGSIPHKAELLGWSKELDLALLRFTDGFVYDGPVGELQDSSALTSMAPVIAMGSPLMMQFTATYGYIANTNALGVHNKNERRFLIDYPQALLHSAQLIEGNSGGPLVDATSGRIVGINSASVFIPSNPVGRLYLAIPSEDILRLIPKLVQGGRVRHGFISGVTIKDSRIIPTDELPDKKRPITEGVIVTKTEPGTLGEKIFRPKDLLLAVEGAPVVSGIGFMREIMHQDPGATVTIKLIREGTLLELLVQLEEYTSP